MLILASASPRRKDLLEQIGLTFEVETADIDETPHLAEDPMAYVKRLAEHKAAAVFARQTQPLAAGGAGRGYNGCVAK